MISRGTTPTLYFSLPFTTDNIKGLSLVFAQNRNIKIRKKLSDCSLYEKQITVTLSQTETLLLDPDYLVDIQLKFLLENGTCVKSTIITETTDICLDEEVL